MAFLDNSGDIILDAVLTDTGRMRLAKGDGSFRITKFALGDDEINYANYDKNNASGSAYFDLNVLQTPIFEAFTNNISSLNSRLVSISRNNLLYLPVILLNDKVTKPAISNIVQNGFVLAVDKNTEDYLATSGLKYDGTTLGTDGIINGFTIGNKTIRLDQGINNTAVPYSVQLDPDLKETQYLVEIDNRFAQIVDIDGTVATPSFIDDDDVATYYFSQGVDTKFIKDNPDTTSMSEQVINGARGTILTIGLKSALEVSTSDYLFNQLGSDVTALFNPAPTNARSIITSVRVTGLTTGYSIDIPVVLIKKIS